MTDDKPVFIKDDKILNPYFAPITELPHHEALMLLNKSGQSGKLPIDLKKICDYEAMPLKFVQIKEENSGARLRQTKGEWLIEIDSKGTGDDDFSLDQTIRRWQRFGVSHELGHYKFKSHCDNNLQVALLSGHNPYAQSYLFQREAQANEFATELLLPIPELKPLLKNLDFRNDFFKSVENLADQFDTSMTATLKRVASVLDIPVIAIHFAPDGKAHQLPSYSKDFKNAGFFFGRNSDIPNNSYAASIFGNKTTAAKGNKVHQDCSVWFPSRRRDDYKVIEWVFNLGRYGILVFLELIEKDNY